MLEGLDRVDWTRLTHAYGSAANVPAALRALALGGTSQATRALATLEDSLCQQGTRYTGTVAAIPFLAELALRRGPKAVGLLHLLRAIAAPSYTAMLKQGQTTRAFYAEGMNGPSPQVAARCHAGAAKVLPALLPLLDTDDPTQAAAMLLFLAEFPADWSESAPRIIDAIAKAEVLAVQRAGLAALGRLSRSVEVGSADPLLRAFLAPDQPLPLRAEAALSMTNQETARRVTLLAALYGAGELYQSDLSDQEVYPRTGWTADRVAACLARWRGNSDMRAEATSAIIATLPQAQAADAATTGLVRALLATLAAGAPVEGLFRGRRRSMLSDLERHALQAIASRGDWIVGDQVNGNFANLMRRCGLPDSAPELARHATRPGPIGRLLRR